MRIVAVRCTPFAIPLRTPVQFSTGSLASAAHVLLEVDTDEGITGVAEVIPRSMVYGESQASIVAAMRDWFAPMVIGLDAFETARARARMAAVVGNFACKGALDIALHDIQGKALGVPCWAMLGRWTAEIRVSCLLGFGEPQAVADAALAAAAAYGFTAFKIKVGRDVARDVRTVRAVREAVGADAVLCVDANHGYSSARALSFLDRAAECDIGWIEEPCPEEDPDGRRRVAEAGRVPVLLDESVRSVTEVAREVRAGAGRMVSIKTPRTGFLESRSILGFCEGSGVDNLVGTQGETGVGTLASLHFAAASARTAAYPAELSWSTVEIADDLLTEPVTVHDGVLRVPERPGIGAVVDPEKLRRYAVEL